MTQGAAPLVSVIVRSMDPPTLPRALASVDLQDHPAIEVVLVAACGPAHRPVEPSLHRFKLNYVVPDGPLPRPQAANAGLDACTGELVTMLDHDDEFLAGHLSGLAAALEADPGAGVAYCRFEVFEQGALYTTVGRPFNRLALFEKSYIHHSALLYRRSLLSHGLRYDTALDIHDDWDFVLQLSEVARFSYLDRTTFRWHADTGTSGGGGLGNFDAEKFARLHAYVRDKWAAVYNRHVDRYNARMESAKRAFAQDDLAGAAVELSALLEDDAAGDPDLLNLLAMVRFRASDPAEARRLLAQALATSDDDARLWFNMGLAAHACHDVPAARRAFQRTLALAPGHPGASAWIARLRS